MDNNQETEYERHFNNGPVPIWIIDAEKKNFLVVNNAAVQKYGYSKEEFLKMTIFDIRPAEDIEATRINFKNRTDAYFDAGYWRHRKKDGAVFYVHIYSHATTISDKAARLCFAIDVDDHVKARKRNGELMEELRDQKEMLDDILFSMNEGIWSRNAETRELIYCNAAYYKLYGMTAEEMGKDINRIVSQVYPPDRAIIAQAFHDVPLTGKAELIHRQILGDGRIRTLKTNAVLKKTKDGQPDSVNGITSDITHEKEMFDAIRNSEQKLLATINNTKDLIWSVDADLKIIYCNRAFQDFFLKQAGVALDEGDFVLGNWNTESFIAKRKGDYGRALAGETFTTIIEELFDGNLFYNEISSNPIIDHDGRIVGVNCFARNITAQRNQMISIREQNERLKEIAWKKNLAMREVIKTIYASMAGCTIADTAPQNKVIMGELARLGDGLEQLGKEIIGITRQIDASFPDNEDVISRL